MWTAEQRERYRDHGRRYPSDLTDAEWALVEPLFAGYATLTEDLREMINACLYLQWTGCPCSRPVLWLISQLRVPPAPA